MAFCKKCGAQLNEGAKFCPKCGQTIEETMKECKECGHLLPEGASVCPECGASFVDVTYEAPERDWYEVDIFGVAITPIMRWFDSGQFIRDIVSGFLTLLAFAFAAAPVYLAFLMQKEKALVGLPSSLKALYLCIIVLLLIFGCFSCGYWSKRGRMIFKLFNPKDEFVGIPMGTYLFQWIGEWLAILSGISGLLMIILSCLKIDNENWAYVFYTIANRNMGFSFIGIGILVAVLFRVSAESGRALASIANNTGRQSRGEDVKSLLDKDNSNESFWNIIYTLSILMTIAFVLAAMLQK